jgi:hypothetical protein
MTEAERLSVMALARRDGLSLADFCRLAILEAASEAGDALPLVVSKPEIRAGRDTASGHRHSTT